MCYAISYEVASPSVIEALIHSKVINALCTWKDNGDYFEFSICGWLPLTNNEILKIKEILAPYV